MADSGDKSSASTITVADVRPKRSGKLRQTCDPCSEAKVKCDKGNPRCGRCDRLSYDCVYSPARRIGRPRPRSRRSPEHDGGACPAPETSCRHTREDASVTTDEATSKKCPTPASAQPPSASGQPARQQTPTSRHMSLDFDEPLPDSLFNDSHWGVPISTSAGTSVGSGCNDRCSTRSSTRSSARGSTRSTDIHHNASTSIGGLISIGREFNSTPNMDEGRRNPYEYDCATVAVATLGALAATGLDGQTTAAAEVLADQIPHACRQAARILVCPCSADMDRALLAASLAAAILDVADTALRALKPPGRALEDEQHTVLALGTIPNISRVVTLFTHRYSATQVGRPPEALSLLAASLRTTLKTMAEDTTNRFLEGGTTSSSHQGGN
ncbi:hypothetical protein CGRA01v4_01999 [Colletotrichum graminicola]|uniref:Zn(2)-C6 fungal-type domain-containing protein n=1 Tax=Colletotrichum graminicola (strain M1.001 / M2 / FGSC 10212) TaxID=645133 RepID=E3QS64_COLGM|nr:uncharacterized protein GLRG_08631 [Colletotrichum graminicola M1.001]EFQ33702.1 hypothetical protein GLRG_08631 [Colletotrichum graminicola M1.001]WDK10720.1 hypothetical protein CGRA01v4_01999 [Colletotrichum graminicola]